MLGNEFGSSANIASAVNFWAISPASTTSSVVNNRLKSLLSVNYLFHQQGNTL